MMKFEKTMVSGYLVEKLIDPKASFCQIAKILSEELDLEHEKMMEAPCSFPVRFRHTMFILDSDYAWGSGWKSPESAIAFKNELLRVFQEHKWSIYIPADNSSCIVVKKRGQAIYCHPSALEGHVIEDDENLSEIISIINDMNASVAVLRDIRMMKYTYSMSPSDLTRFLFSDRVTSLIGWWILTRTDGRTDNVPLSNKDRLPYTIRDILSDLNVLFSGSSQLETYWTMEQFAIGLYKMLVKTGDLKISEKMAHCHYGETIVRKFKMKKDKYKVITSPASNS